MPTALRTAPWNLIGAVCGWIEQCPCEAGACHNKSRRGGAFLCARSRGGGGAIAGGLADRKTRRGDFALFARAGEGLEERNTVSPGSVGAQPCFTPSLRIVSRCAKLSTNQTRGRDMSCVHGRDVAIWASGLLAVTHICSHVSPVPIHPYVRQTLCQHNPGGAARRVTT